MSDTIDQAPPGNQGLSTGKKAPKKREPAKEGKPSKSELFWRLKAVVDRKPTALRARFPETFQVYNSDKTTKLIVSEDEHGVCTLVNEKYLGSVVARYLEDVLIKDATDAWVFGAKDLLEFAKTWVYFADPVSEPKAWTFKSGSERSFVRLPWDPEPGPTPTWDSFLSRASDPETLMAYLGSLFVDASDRQQYLWLYGEGNDGKGSLFRFLHRCFGASFGNEYVPGHSDRFWTSGLLNKRIVVFPDCNNYSFVTTGLFKSLTGGDPVRIERKGEPAFTALIHAKFIFGSNEQPKISGEKSDMRRLIYVEMRLLAFEPDPHFETKLWNEGGCFIYKCLQAYRKASPDHLAIAVDQERIEELSATTELDLAAVAQLFDFHPDYECTGTDFQNLARQHLNRFRYPEFIKYLRRVHGVTQKRVRLSEKQRPLVYCGVKPTVSHMAPSLLLHHREQ